MSAKGNIKRWRPSRRALLVLRGTLVAVVLAAFFLPVAIVALPWIEFFNDMAAQPMARSQMTYGRTHGKKLMTERPAVPGTVPRNGPLTYPFSTPEKAPGKKLDKAELDLRTARWAGKHNTSPRRRTVANMKRGQQRYDIFCKTCHGSQGDGDGPATGQDRFPAPPSLHTDKARAYRDGTIYHIITRGIGKMPGYADKVEPAERWDIIAYLRALQRAKNPKPKDLKK